MAEFTETRTPYEFLVRWNKDGTIQGSHVGWLDTVKKDGEILTQTPSNVEAVGADGFPLNDILSQLQIDSLKEIDVLKAEAVLINQEKITLKSENSSLIAQVLSLEKQIEDLKTV